MRKFDWVNFLLEARSTTSSCNRQQNCNGVCYAFLLAITYAEVSELANKIASMYRTVIRKTKVKDVSILTRCWTFKPGRIGTSFVTRVTTRRPFFNQKLPTSGDPHLHHPLTPITPTFLGPYSVHFDPVALDFYLHGPHLSTRYLWVGERINERTCLLLAQGSNPHHHHHHHTYTTPINSA